MDDWPREGPFDEFFAKAIVSALFDTERPLESAKWLDRCVESLVPGVAEQPTPNVREMYVDLMMGLALTAESFRAQTQSDPVSADESRLRAIRCLDRVRPEELVFAAGFRLPDGGMWS